MYSVRAGPGGGQECVSGRAHPSPSWYPPYSRAVAPGASGGSSGRSACGAERSAHPGRLGSPLCPTLPASVFPGSREGAGAQKTIRGRLVACGESSEWGREWEGLEVGMTLRDMWTPSLPGIHKFSFLLRKMGTVTSQERGCAVAHIAVLSRLVCGEPFCPCLLGLAALGKPIPPFVICPVFRECD